jgi:hypothetical protein
MTSQQWLAEYLEQEAREPGPYAPDAASADAARRLRDLLADPDGWAEPPPGFYYQAWMKGPRGLVTIGTFHMRGGPGTVELWSAVSLTDYPAITVTREPEDGNPASSGQVVLTNRRPGR